LPATIDKAGLIHMLPLNSKQHQNTNGIPTTDAPFAGWLGTSNYPPSQTAYVSGLQTVTPTLLAVSQKDHRTFIHAMAILHARGVFARATIVGGENQRQLGKTIALAQALNLQGHIQFTSDLHAQAEQDRSRISRHNHILAVTCTEKNNATLISESIAVGYAVIAMENNDGLIEDGVTGYNVPSLDAQTLADVSEKLLRNPLHARAIVQAASARLTDSYDHHFRRA
jgi:glycosyltransferase involved in cell wall biosynthesis